MTPLEKVEALFEELVSHYGEASEREIRAAAKLLMVALAKFKDHGGPNWECLLEDYVRLLKNDPQRFDRILQSNRTPPSDTLLA